MRRWTPASFIGLARPTVQDQPRSLRVVVRTRSTTRCTCFSTAPWASGRSLVRAIRIWCSYVCTIGTSFGNGAEKLQGVADQVTALTVGQYIDPPPAQPGQERPVVAV